MEIALLLLASLVILFIVYVVLFAVVRQRTQDQARRVMASLSGERVVAVSVQADLFGQESLGPDQARGPGTLVLTEKELYFEGLKPRREWTIPLSAITDVATPNSFLGRPATKRLLLMVLYADEQGRPDAIAWQVPDAKEWEQKIRELA